MLGDIGCAAHLCAWPVQSEVNELHDTVHGLSDELAQQRHTVVELESARDHLHVGGRYFQGFHNACQVETMHPMKMLLVLTHTHAHAHVHLSTRTAMKAEFAPCHHIMTRYTQCCCP